jgi:hypothetical protein
MVVTELPIVTEVNLLHQSNAASPIVVTEFGILTEVNPSQLEKAPRPIDVTVYETSLNLTFRGILTEFSYSLL